MRLYCLSQTLRKGQIICSDLQSERDTQNLNMQSVTFTIMSIHPMMTSLNNDGDGDRSIMCDD